MPIGFQIQIGITYLNVIKSSLRPTAMRTVCPFSTPAGTGTVIFLRCTYLSNKLQLSTVIQMQLTHNFCIQFIISIDITDIQRLYVPINYLI